MSYLGRAQYLSGDLCTRAPDFGKKRFRAQERQFRTAIPWPYYNLGDQKAALTNIQRGMKGIYNWLNYLNENFRFEFGQEWDAGGTIRAGIESDLAMISSGNVDWPKLIADARER